MIQLIIGEKGKGKTKILLDKVNTEVRQAEGNCVYLDKSKQKSFDINNKVRLIDVTSYNLGSADEFIGFILGIISQDHDLEKVYLDSFLTIAHLEGQDISAVLDRLSAISEKYKVDFVLSISLSKEQLPEKFAPYVID